MIWILLSGLDELRGSDAVREDVGVVEFYKGTNPQFQRHGMSFGNRVRPRGWLELDCDSGRGCYWSAAAVQ